MRLAAAFLLLLLLVGCASVATQTQTVRVEGLGNVRLQLESPEEVVFVQWAGVPGMSVPVLWIAVRCHCGLVHLGMVIPKQGGAEIRFWETGNTLMPLTQQ
jgi:hypothetical protein